MNDYYDYGIMRLYSRAILSRLKSDELKQYFRLTMKNAPNDNTPLLLTDKGYKKLYLELQQTLKDGYYISSYKGYNLIYPYGNTDYFFGNYD